MTDLSLHGIPLATVLRLNAARVVPLARYHEDNACDRFGYRPWSWRPRRSSAAATRSPMPGPPHAA
jgi:hypothetical protein